MVADFVGRVAELARLNTLLAGARAGRPATVLVDGDAGLGKTRLLREFTAHARRTGAQVLAGGCVPLGAVAIPYGPLIEALRALVRQEGDQRVRELAGPGWPDLAGMVADLAGEPVDRPDSQHRVFGAVSRLLARLGASAPVVLVLEDLQWTDPSTVDMVAYLTRMRGTERLLLVGSYRAGLPVDHPLRGLLAEPEFMRGSVRLSLRPLSDAESWRLFAGLVTEHAPRERVARYVELAEGNPYFAEQLAVADDPAARIPESLNEIMRLRLARLSAPAMRLARVAAVAGRRVNDGLLAGVLGDEQELDDALRECLDRRVLLVDQDLAETYVFQHALLREAAYATASPRERRRLHAAMAETITTTPGLDGDPRLLPELAHHWFAAGRVREALDAAVRAGVLAGALRAFKEADTQYQHALTLWPEVPDAEEVAGVRHVHVLSLAADAARWAGRLTSAVDLARQAIGATDTDQAGRGELYERLGSYLWEAGQVAESAAAYRTADELLAGRPPTTVSVRVRSALATAEVRAGRYTEALRIAEQAVDQARQLGAVAEEGRALNSVGLAATMLDAVADGEAALRASVRIATEAGHLEDMLRAYGNLGVCLDHAGELARAVDAMTTGLDQARALGVPHTRQAGVLGNNAGVALFRLGRWDEATERLGDAVAHRPLGESSYPRLTMAEIDVARGRFDAAAAALDGLRSQPNTDPRFVAALYCCLAELATWRDDPAGARAAVEHGLAAVAGTEDTRAVVALCAVGLRVADGRRAAELLAMATVEEDRPGETTALVAQCAAEYPGPAGDEPAARWRAVAAAWRALDRPYPLAYAECRAAEAALVVGRRPAAASAARAAHAIATDLDAQPLLARITLLAKRNRLRLTTTEQRERPHGLTIQELAVLRAASGGASNREVGKQLSISDKTVGVHLYNLFRKLAVHSRVEAIDKARRSGLLDD
ncbi:helix-turn-helix transcriptional regulator [Actinophytocola sediminis]